MAVWITPIFDRTQADCDNKTYKGSLQYSDLYRLEHNIEYMTVLLTQANYPIDVQTTHEGWLMTKYIKVDYFNKIENTINSFMTSFSHSPDVSLITLSTCNTPLLYSHLNLMEYALYDLKWLFEWMTRVAPICGDMYCGG